MSLATEWRSLTRSENFVATWITLIAVTVAGHTDRGGGQPLGNDLCADGYE